MDFEGGMFGGDGSLPSSYGSGTATGGAGFASPVGTGVEAGGNPVTQSGMPMPPRVPPNGPSNSQYQPGAYPGTPDNGHPSPNYGESGWTSWLTGGGGQQAAPTQAQARAVASNHAVGPAFNGSGGWQYQPMADGSFSVLAPATHRGLRVQPNTAAWNAVQYERTTGKTWPGTSGGASSQAAAAPVSSGQVKGQGLSNLLNSLTGLVQAAGQSPGRQQFQPSQGSYQRVTAPPVQNYPVAAPAAASTVPWGWILGGVVVLGLVGGGAYWFTQKSK